MLLKRNTVDGEIQIRDGHTDNNDIMAIVPLTEDEKYDKKVMSPFADAVCNLPQVLKASRKLLKVLKKYHHLLVFTGNDFDRAVDKLKEAIDPN